MSLHTSAQYLPEMTSRDINFVTHSRRKRKKQIRIPEDFTSNQDYTAQKYKSILKKHFSQESHRQNYSSLISKGREKILSFNTRTPDSGILEKSGNQYNTLIKWKLGCTKLDELEPTISLDSDYICPLCSTRSLDDFQTHLLTECLKTKPEIGTYRNELQKIVGKSEFIKFCNLSNKGTCVYILSAGQKK